MIGIPSHQISSSIIACLLDGWAAGTVENINHENNFRWMTATLNFRGRKSGEQMAKLDFSVENPLENQGDAKKMPHKLGGTLFPAFSGFLTYLSFSRSFTSKVATRVRENNKWEERDKEGEERMQADTDSMIG